MLQSNCMETSTATQPLSSVAASSKRNVRVLYLEDMQELRDIMRISLSRDGHEIECVEEGEVALQRVIEDPGFDLIITDHHMPRMNGLEFVTHLRAMMFRGKIVVFSSDVNPKVATEYRKLGVDRMIY